MNSLVYAVQNNGVYFLQNAETSAGQSEASFVQIPEPVSPPLWLLAVITFSGTLAMHIFVPALPMAALGLGASSAQMQLTISFYILGLAVGQLFYGPVSDRFGRRPVLLAGLFLYVSASLAALFSANVQMLIGARLLQALGGCAGLVIGRAMVRDTAA
jgi:DHA1 family bicyclomycin/chloramphenicol resistance-like MFS transporter